MSCPRMHANWHEFRSAASSRRFWQATCRRGTKSGELLLVAEHGLPDRQVGQAQKSGDKSPHSRAGLLSFAFVVIGVIRGQRLAESTPHPSLSPIEAERG